jgi:prolyl oligopeptidase
LICGDFYLKVYFFQVNDPYRFLEDPDSEETQKFVDEQNAVTKPFLEEGGDSWKKINQKLTSLWEYEKFGCPAKHGSRYFFSHNTGLQNQNVIYYQDSLKAEKKVFLDPNQFSSDGTVALQSLHFTRDGKFLAYGISASGSDWVKIKFRNVDTNTDFPETLEFSKFFQPTWTHDNKGVFYGRFIVDSKADGSETNANENQKVYYHRLGDKQENDILVAEFPEEPRWRSVFSFLCTLLKTHKHSLFQILC